MKRFLLLFLATWLAGTAAIAAEGKLLVLCYHDVPESVWMDNYGVDRDSFVQQLEYLRTHGYRFVSLGDVLAAQRKEKALPPKAVLLTFDDAYKSYYDFVFPLLKTYGYPSVLAVITGWIDSPPRDIKMSFMNWDQLREVAHSGLVDIASHSNSHHCTVRYTPQGNYWYAFACRRYMPERGGYETGDEWRQRVSADLAASKRALEEKLGVKVRALAWPYGEYTRQGIAAAHSVGYEALFALNDTFATGEETEGIPRYIIVKNPSITAFSYAVNKGMEEPSQQRILQADLDQLYSEDPETLRKNIDAFVQRVDDMQVNTVYLQAFCDDRGDGNIASVYFPNRVLPVKADLFNFVANQLANLDVQVYAWMPMLSIELPEPASRDGLYVREFADGKNRASSSWYRRLSPFSGEAVAKLAMLYEDMAVNARIAGVVFQDDGYLNDYEDFSPAALAEYRGVAGDAAVPFQELDDDKKQRWTRLKTRKLIEVTERLKEAVREYRPSAKFARTLYAPVLMEPESEEWFAQNYADSLKAYDYVVVMAYPRMEEVKRPVPWLKAVVRAAEKYPGGLEKTVFKAQSFDWKRNRWVSSKELDAWLRSLVAAGARHIAYYPDDCLENRPELNMIRRMMSTEDFPFKRTLEEKMRR